MNLSFTLRFAFVATMALCITAATHDIKTDTPPMTPEEAVAYWCADDAAATTRRTTLTNVLTDLFLSTSGDQWTISDSWGDANVCICSWDLVDCTTDPTFISLPLSDNHLNGTLPISLGNEDVFRSLDFSHNHINGTIPENFNKLIQLRSLDLSGNHLIGKVPMLNNLKDIQNISLDSNNLGGYVEDSMFSCEGCAINLLNNTFWCPLPSFCDEDTAFCSPCVEAPDCEGISRCACEKDSSCCTASWSTDSCIDTAEAEKCYCSHDLTFWTVFSVMAAIVFVIVAAVFAGGCIIYFVNKRSDLTSGDKQKWLALAAEEDFEIDSDEDDFGKP